MKSNEPFGPLIAVIDFHHARSVQLQARIRISDFRRSFTNIASLENRGPEVESWIGNDDNEASTEKDSVSESDWSLLPFMALSDGAHT